MNLDLMYLATELTGDAKYATVASTQAETMIRTHIRADGTTYHVVDLGRDGSAPKGMTAQGGWWRVAAWSLTAPRWRDGADDQVSPTSRRGHAARRG